MNKNRDNTKVNVAGSYLTQPSRSVYNTSLSTKRSTPNELLIKHFANNACQTQANHNRYDTAHAQHAQQLRSATHAVLRFQARHRVRTDSYCYSCSLCLKVALSAKSTK